jgi:hypothetical protein
MKNFIKVSLETIMQLCYEINADTERAAFVNYSGHVDSLSVQITKSKKEYENVLYTINIYLKDFLPEKQLRDELMGIIKTLQTYKSNL